MNEILNDNNSIKSTDNIECNNKKNIEIITDVNNLDSIKLNNEIIKDSKSQANIIDNINLNNIHMNTYSDELPILEPKIKYNTLNTDNIINSNQDIQKKRIEKKTNLNLKLLKVVKERLKEKKYKKLIEEEKKEKIKNDTNKDLNKDNNLEEEKQKISEEKNTSNKDEKENENSRKNLDEEKKNKLLNIISSKKYNKFQRKYNEKEKEKENNQQEKSDKENIKIENNNNINNNSNDDKNKGINSPVSKKEKETPPIPVRDEEKRKNTYNNNNKQKEPISNNIRMKHIFSAKNLNINGRSLSAKKDTMALLELLKMKKRKENESKTKKDNETNNNEENDINNNNKRIIKRIDSYNYKPRKRIFETFKKNRNIEIVNSFSKKSIKNDKEINNNNDFYNKTQGQFHNYKTINNSHIQNNNYNNNNNDNNGVKNYFKLNNKIIKPMTNVVNNSYINRTKIFPKINRINYNPISIKNKFREKLNNYYTINDIKNGSQNNSNNNSLQQLGVVYKNNTNTRTVENSFDLNRPFSKKILNKSTINQRINKAKVLTGNNNPPKLINYERNTLGTENITYNNNNNYLNFSKDKNNSKPYIKKNSDKFNYYNDFNNNSIEKNIHNHNRTMYNKKPKNIINDYKNKNTFSTSYNILTNNNGKLISIENNSINGPELSETFNTKKSETINTNHNSFYTNKMNKIKNLKSLILSKHQNNTSIIFNLEDLIILEERLDDIILSLDSNDNIANKCFNYWNYYYNCSLFNLIEKIFKNKEDSNIVRLSINYKLLSIMVCYKYSFELDSSKEELSYSLIELIDLNYNNLIIIYEYILTKIAPENKQNIWVLKLQQIIKNSKSYENHPKNESQSFIEKINNNTNSIGKKLKNVLQIYPSKNNDILISLLQNLDTKTYEELNNVFRKNILRVNNFEGSITATSYLKKNKFFKPLQGPYLKYPSQKPYTLILDLDETLVHFKIKSSKAGTLRARPYLFGFLEEMGHYYELIVWTSATEAYANSLIDAVEYEKKYFDYVLYREHAIIMDDDFVKDLTRIGRDLDKVIIIDDMPQNFRLQKENGITIKPFYGNDLDDSALYDLVPILKHIAEEGKDVRIGLQKYREEIVKKVTSNISKKKF